MPSPKPRRSRKTPAEKEGGSPPPASPVELAIRYLGPRRRFEREVRLHLKKKQVPAAVIEAAIARLHELDLVSDEDTARAWIRDRMNFAPRGRALLRRELLSKGVAAPVVEEALEVWQAYHPDIVLLDVMLPRMSGVDVCREIRSVDDTPVIMVSARNEEIDAVVALEVGADDYVSKPYRVRELVA